MYKEDLKSYSVFKLVKKINAGHSLVFAMAWILTLICLFNSTESSGFMFMFMLIISVYMIMEIVYFVVRIIIFNKLYSDICNTKHPDEDIPRSIKRVKLYRVLDILVFIITLPYFILSFIALIARIVGFYQSNLLIKEMEENYEKED